MEAGGPLPPGGGRASAAAEAERVSVADPAVVARLVEDLPAYGWEWRPDTPFADIPTLPAAPADPRRRFLDLVLCGLIFDAYAQRLSGGPEPALRVLQPRRARLLAQAATGAPPDEAFAAVGRRVGLVSLPQAPTFLPLLLQESDILTPAHLADRLMVWRTTPA